MFDIFIFQIQSRLPRLYDYKIYFFIKNENNSNHHHKHKLSIQVYMSKLICMSANGSSKDFLVDFNGFSFYHSRLRLSRLFKWETWKAADPLKTSFFVWETSRCSSHIGANLSHCFVLDGINFVDCIAGINFPAEKQSFTKNQNKLADYTRYL